VRNISTTPSSRAHTDGSRSRDTDKLVETGIRYYPTKASGYVRNACETYTDFVSTSLQIPIAHYQLRHLISSGEPDLLFYASGPDVYSLNTITHCKTLVTTLPWDARCSASGHGTEYQCTICMRAAIDFVQAMSAWVAPMTATSLRSK
jgi:hypothetical protein